MLVGIKFKYVNSRRNGYIFMYTTRLIFYVITCFWLISCKWDFYLSSLFEKNINGYVMRTKMHWSMRDQNSSVTEDENYRKIYVYTQLFFVHTFGSNYQMLDAHICMVQVCEQMFQETSIYRHRTTVTWNTCGGPAGSCSFE